MSPGIKNKSILLLIILCFFLKVRAQDNKGDVVGVSGGYGQVSGQLADWSVGNLVASTYSLDNGQLLSQGFLQPEYAFVRVTLDFALLPGKTFGDVNFELHATASNGRNIVYSSSNPNVAIIVNGNIVQIVGAGESDIVATVEGTAISVTQKLLVDRATQTITFDIIPVLIAGGQSYTVNATASSGLPVKINSDDVFTLRVDGKILIPMDIGKVLVTLSQDGNANYYPAAVTQFVQITDESGGKIKLPTLVTPNGDGINDVLIIKGVEDYPDNQLVVLNRNGTKCFNVKNYDNGAAVFDGRPGGNQPFEGKAFFKDLYLPQGTYFYIFHYLDPADGETKKKVGFFVLKY